MDKLATKGRIVGEALAVSISPGDALTKTLLGSFGSFVGRRLTRGHPLISVGGQVLLAKKPKRPKEKTMGAKAVKKPRISKLLGKRKKPTDKP